MSGHGHGYFKLQKGIQLQLEDTHEQADHAAVADQLQPEGLSILQASCCLQAPRATAAASTLMHMTLSAQLLDCCSVCSSGMRTGNDL